MASFHVWFLDTVHPALEEALTASGMTCHDATRISREAVINQGQSPPPVDGLVLRSRIRLDREVLNALPDLKWVA